MKKNIIYILGVLVVVIVLALVLNNRSSSSGPQKFDEFASCLKDKGAVFYGAFWCPHCREQKDMFGKSVKLLPYVECSTPDGQGQLQICKDKNIQSYPTWDFIKGTTTQRLSGSLSLSALSENTGCKLPEN